MVLSTCYVAWLLSENGKRFPRFVFSGDTDMATEGLGSLTSWKGNEIILTEYSEEEWALCCQMNADFVKGSKMFEERVNRELGRDDLRDVWFIAKKGDGLFYRDIFSEKGEARQTSRQKSADFVKKGGILTKYQI